MDALLGTGLSGEVEGSIKRAILAVNASLQPVLALDIPSGISADTGAVLGTAVEATCTVTFIADKIGFTYRRCAVVYRRYRFSAARC